MEYKAENYFGELALLKDSTRGATITATSTLVVLKLRREHLKNVIGKSHDILMKQAASYIDAVAVTFTEDGSLGLKFSPNGNAIQVLQVNPGTQAEQHSELHAGMTLMSVGGNSTEGLSYQVRCGNFLHVCGPAALCQQHRVRF